MASNPKKLIGWPMRTEFGVERTSCACDACRRCCRFLSPWLIPSDLERLIPKDADPLKWAESNLLASPGPLVVQVVEQEIHCRSKPQQRERRLVRRGIRVPGLVLAANADGSCRFLTSVGECSIHEVSPFGCSFFDGHERRSPASDRLLRAGLISSIEAGPEHLYHRLRRHLIRLGLVSPPPEVQRGQMRRAITLPETDKPGKTSE
jgi:Fe-S-cluster containining protein